MSRKENDENLPIIEIGGTKFYVDLQIDALREVDDPLNAIGFFDMAKNEEGYLLLYDPLTKNLFEGTAEDKAARTDLQSIQLPDKLDLDPVGLIESIREDSRKMRLGR